MRPFVILLELGDGRLEVGEREPARGSTEQIWMIAGQACSSSATAASRSGPGEVAASSSARACST